MDYEDGTTYLGRTNDASPVPGALKTMFRTDHGHAQIRFIPDNQPELALCLSPRIACEIAIGILRCANAAALSAPEPYGDNLLPHVVGDDGVSEPPSPTIPEVS